MKQKAIFDTESAIPLRLAFETLKILSDQHLITGTDDWRRHTDRGSLADIDAGLANTVQKQPPSKFGHAQAPSLWTATHFYLALPVLSYALTKYGKEDAATRNLVLHKKELQQYFIAFPHIIRHYREYKQLVELFGAPTEKWWNDTLRNTSGQVHDGAPATGLLESLPPYLQEKATQVLSGQNDSMTGRIVLAHLLGQGTSREELPFDKHTDHYLAPMHANAPTQTLYERLIAAQQELSQLDPYLSTYDQGQSLRLEQFLGLVSWYGRPHLVEMMIPGLTGAAEPAIRSLSVLFRDIVQNGAPDYTAPTLVSLPSVEKFRNTQSLETIGRLSIVKDILAKESQDGLSEGTVLRQMAQCLYNESDRKLSWGNTEYYIPDARRESGFATFRQDIANVIYCAGLFTEHENNMAGTVESEALKQFAVELVHARSTRAMRTLMHTHRRILNSLAIDWEIRYAGHERLRLLRFVQQTFGLDTIKPIPIPIGELNKGFAGSYCDGRVYHLHYQEAGEKLEMAITLRTTQREQAVVRYCIAEEHEEARLSPDGLPYSVWLEVTQPDSPKRPVIIPVPGRGTFDPFGRVGSPHAGEVIGFGCSVHHASLAIILAELASLGASNGDLEQVTFAFMRINQTVHERYDLAAFQLAQIIAIFETEAPYTYRDYLRSRQDIIPDSTRPYLTAYARAGKKSLAWAEPQAARLSFGYPTLYPVHGKVRINPRSSWYDGRAVELPDATVTWQVLTS